VDPEGLPGAAVGGRVGGGRGKGLLEDEDVPVLVAGEGHKLIDSTHDGGRGALWVETAATGGGAAGLVEEVLVEAAEDRLGGVADVDAAAGTKIAGVENGINTAVLVRPGEGGDAGGVGFAEAGAEVVEAGDSGGGEGDWMSVGVGLGEGFVGGAEAGRGPIIGCGWGEAEGVQVMERQVAADGGPFLQEEP
jgi:hypothetical protein